MFTQHLKRAGLNAAEVRAFTTAKEFATYPSENPVHAMASKTGADLVLFDDVHPHPDHLTAEVRPNSPSNITDESFSIPRSER